MAEEEKRNDGGIDDCKNTVKPCFRKSFRGMEEKGGHGRWLWLSKLNSMPSYFFLP